MRTGVSSIPLDEPGGDWPLLPGGSSPRGGRLRALVTGPENAEIDALVELMRRRASASEDDPAGDAAAAMTEWIVLVGPSGSGKSELARLVARQLDRPGRPSTTCVLPTLDFARQLHEAIETRNVESWRESLRTCDTLVLEDITTIDDKPTAQVELVHLLDARREAGRVTIFTSRQIGDLTRDLLPQLASRLTSAWLVRLSLPSSATRLELVRRLAHERQTPIGEGALRALAEGLPVSAAELCGALVSLETAAKVQGHAIDAQHVRTYVERVQESRSLTLRTIAQQTARYYGVTLGELRSASRRQAIVTARNMAMYAARQLTGQSLERIGEYFGGRDHTTVLHGCRKIEEQLPVDPLARKSLEEIRILLGRA